MVKRNSSYEEDEGYELPEKKRKGFGHNDGDEGENEGDGGDGHGDGNSLAKPIGEVVRVSRKGRSLRKHYKYFESEGEIYTLEDEVLLSPEKPHEKPYIAIIKDIGRICWPDTAVSVINALEKASFDALASDFQKYNQKIRQLVFNLKNNTLLAKRLLNKELDPVDVVNMTPQELKDGLTAEDRPTREPEVSERMQMTDARCSRCLEKKVGVADIIQAGRRGNRYQLECIACGHTWFSSQDGISSLTVDTPNITQHVGTSPLATAELKAIKKSKAMPSGTEKQTANVYQKAPATQKEKWVKR